MNEELKDALRFRRQYILTPEKIQCPFRSHVIHFSNHYTLYTHIDLLVTQFTEHKTQLILLGDIFDYESAQKNNLDILKELYDKDFRVILSRLEKYCGRFVLIYQKGDEFKVVHDATASRKIYYNTSSGDIWCASQAHLLARVTGSEKSKDESLLKYYGSREFLNLDNSNIGDLTCYTDIKQVLPNHYLDFQTLKVERFWPNKKIKPLSSGVSLRVSLPDIM